MKVTTPIPSGMVMKPQNHFAGEFQMSDVMSMSKDHNDNDSNTNVSHRKSRASARQ